MKVAERTIWLAIVVVGALLVLAIIFPPEGRAHLIVQSKPKQTKEQIHANQTKNLAHVRYVCRRGKAETKRWHCRTARWLYREWKQTLPAPTYGVGYWAQRQINAANHLAANSALHGLYGTITRIRNSNGEFFPPQPIAVNGGSKFVNLAHVVETWAVGE